MEIAKILNGNACEYNYNKDKQCVEILSEPNLNNKAKTIYEFYDYNVKCYKLKYFEKLLEYNYVNT
ncbi:MAG: hypothetical protein J5779_02435, partial [Clostridia bacterium]|nr:hypothetical protein [Clostridia bacterium]